MKNANEKYIEYARVIQMCKGTKFENEPWKCIKGVNSEYISHPLFGDKIDLEFAVAIVEDELVFMGDPMFIINNPNPVNWELYDYWKKDVERLSKDWTRTPPKRTFMLNGVELPYPNNTPNGLELRIVGFKDHAYHFTAVDELRIVEIAINRLFTDKC